MKTIEIFDTILLKVQGISYPFQQFLKEIWLIFLIAQGKRTFKNLARISGYEEKIFRRNYEKELKLSQFTQILVEKYGQEKPLLSVVSLFLLKIMKKILTEWENSGQVLNKKPKKA